MKTKKFLNQNSADELVKVFIENKMNIRKIDDNTISLSFDEVTEMKDLADVIKVFAKISNQKIKEENIFASLDEKIKPIDEPLQRKTPYLKQKIFNSIHSELQMLRLLALMQQKDISMAKSMIPLGSCTMKLTPTSSFVFIFFI